MNNEDAINALMAHRVRFADDFVWDKNTIEALDFAIASLINRDDNDFYWMKGATIMPRFNVQHPQTKKWRCFSSIVDDWITDWMPEDEYEQWRREEYGRIFQSPLRRTNRMSLEEAESIIKRVHPERSEE